MFWWGFGGSAAIEIVTAARYYYPPHSRLPSRYNSFTFYIVRLLLAVVAGGLAVAYQIDKPLLALHVGAATPLIMQALAQTTPTA